MPTYEYLCGACDHTFEEFQSITAKSLRKCPACGRPKLKRLIGTGAGVIFKGSGFYETDYRSESYKKGEKAEKDKTDSSKSDSGKSESSKSDSTKSDSTKSESTKSDSSTSESTKSKSSGKSPGKKDGD